MASPVPDSYSVGIGQAIYAGRSNMQAWVQAHDPWEWFEIANTALSSVDPSPWPMGKNPSFKISAWNGTALKRQGSVVLLGAAGGHGDYPGNEVNALVLNTPVPAWSQLRGPSANADLIKETPVYLDLRRAALHNYWSTQFDSVNNRMLIVSSGGMHGTTGTPPAPPGNWEWPINDAVFMGFDLGTNDWTHPNDLARFPWGSSGSADLCCTNYATGEIFYVKSQQGSMYKYNPSSDVWINVGSFFMNGGYRGSAIDPTRNRMLIVGGFSGTEAPIVRNTLNAAAVSVTFGGLGASALQMSGYPGVVYDEMNDCFLVAKNTNPITLYRVDAETFEVDIPVTTGTTPAQRPNAMLNAIQYVPELRGVVLVNSHSGNVKFMRTAA